MVRLGKTDSGQFCWLDLAATNADRANILSKALRLDLSRTTGKRRQLYPLAPVGSGRGLDLSVTGGAPGSWNVVALDPLCPGERRDRRRPASRPARWHCCCSSLPCFGRRAHSTHPGFGRRTGRFVGADRAQHESKRSWLERRHGGQSAARGKHQPEKAMMVCSMSR